jgi:hypothetical protein
MTPAGEPEVPPPAYLYAHAVAGSISLAAAMVDPENIEDNYKLMLAQGIDLARGGNGMVEAG